MRWKAEDILSIFDGCCPGDFPMLDNGYVYLAASRLSLYRSATEWGMVIEVFGYSPRSGVPDTAIYTFASALYSRDLAEKYVSRKAYETYLSSHPHDEVRFIYPVSNENWKNAEDYDEFILDDAIEVVVRDRPLRLPPPEEYGHRGIKLTNPPRVRVFELCRFLAEIDREHVLATPRERCVSIQPDMKQILQLEEWSHPNTADGNLPSQSQTFQQLAQILVTGDIGVYRPLRPANTHWRNWPDGGTL